MYRVINVATAVLMGEVESPIFIKPGEHCSFVPATEEEATGVVFEHYIYDLEDHTGLPGSKGTVRVERYRGNLAVDRTPLAGSRLPISSGGAHEALSNMAIRMIRYVSGIEVKPVLNDNTWAAISEVSRAGLGDCLWAIGDCKEITITGTVGTLAVDQTFCVYIIGFDHNYEIEGRGIHFGCFKTALSGGKDVCLTDTKYNSSSGGGYKYFNMNHWGGNSLPYNTSYGGWKGCDLRYDILGSTNVAPSGYGAIANSSRTGYDAPATTTTNPVENTLMAALPADLRAVMKPITKYSNNRGYGTSRVTTTSVDYLPLLSYLEVWGDTGIRSASHSYEADYQKQYEYYRIGNSKLKYRHSNTGTISYWWYRSYGMDNGYFRYNFTTEEEVMYAFVMDCKYSYGLSPIFMV